MPVVGAQMTGLGGYACPKKGVTLGTETLSAGSRCPQTEQTRLPTYLLPPTLLPDASSERASPGQKASTPTHLPFPNLLRMHGIPESKLSGESLCPAAGNDRSGVFLPYPTSLSRCLEFHCFLPEIADSLGTKFSWEWDNL